MSTHPERGFAWKVIETVGSMPDEGREPGELVHGAFED
jgi:hypothetical protein